MPRKIPKVWQKGKPYSPEEKEAIINAIKPFLQLGYDLKKACVQAQVYYETVWKWVKKDKALAIQVQAWRGMLGAKSREVVADSIISKKNTSDAKWWLERVEKDQFAERVEQTGAGGEKLNADVFVSVEAQIRKKGFSNLFTAAKNNNKKTEDED